MITSHVRLKSGLYYLFLFLLASLLINAHGLPKAMDLPIGAVLSQGNVKMEFKDHVWRTVEPPYSPILKGKKIKIEKGSARISLSNHSLIEVSQNSLLSFEHVDQLNLLEGGIHFEIPSTARMNFKIKTLSVAKSYPPNNPEGLTTTSIQGKETRGSLFLHPDGSLTVRCVQGSLSVLDHENRVLTTTSSKDPISIPPKILSGKETWRMDQRVGVAPQGAKEKGQAPPGVERREVDALEKYLIDFSKYLEGKDLPANLDAQKFFSLLEAGYPYPDIIEKVKQYPIKVRREGNSYVLVLCDKRSKWMLYKDRGETTDFVDHTYGIEGLTIPCQEVVLPNELWAVWTTQALAAGGVLILGEDDRDSVPLCP